jgi:hypothetical protein
VTGVLVDDESRVGDRRGQALLLVAGQQLVLLAPDDERGCGDAPGGSRGFRVAQAMEGLAPHVRREKDAVPDPVLDVPLRHPLEAREPGQGLPHPRRVHRIGQRIDRVGERRPTAQAAR